MQKPAILLFAVVFNFGCSGSEAVTDAGFVDAAGDSGALLDTGPLDRGATDTGADAGPVDTATADTGPTDTGPEDVMTTTMVSFSADVQPIFTRYCTRCHGGNRPSARLDLTSRTGLHAHIVDANLRAISCRNETTSELVTKIIAPGQPLQSAMIRKAGSMDSEAACDKEMPPRNGALITVDPAAYETLRLWVEQGAADN